MARSWHLHLLLASDTGSGRAGRPWARALRLRSDGRRGGLRTHGASGLADLGDSILDLAQQHLSDGTVISAEKHARAGSFRVATQLIAGIRPGSIPLFTEGFSLLTHGVRELLNLNSKSIAPEQRPSIDDLEKVKLLKQHLDKWAPYIELNCPTTSFFGSNVLRPTLEEVVFDFPDSAGWKLGPTP